MNLSTIPITLRNGRVRPLKTEYWRLVLPGEVIEKGDEYWSLGSIFKPCKETVDLTQRSWWMLKRRRVKGGKS